VSLIAIGVSTGGPNALADLVPRLPADLGVPVVIVQHMPPMFTRLLAERLDARSALRVAEGVDGAPVHAGQVWIAPGDRHLEVVRHAGGLRLRTTLAPPENSCRPAVDVLFRTATAADGPGVLAVVLTGMGVDGRRGAELVRSAGGAVLAQDEASSVVWGMPGAVVRAGLADAVVPLEGMAAALTRRVGVAGAVGGAVTAGR
jgi:two-component system chemotaxis response regulator CheB